MRGQVFARRRTDWGLYVIDSIREAGNGVIDLTGRSVEGGFPFTAGWWRWWVEDSHGFNEAMERLASVPGWKPEFADKIRQGAIDHASSSRTKARAGSPGA